MKRAIIGSLALSAAAGFAYAQQTPPPAGGAAGEMGQGSSSSLQFSTVDANSDGRVSSTEAQAHPQLSAEFSKLDTNSDGYLSQSEFSKLKSGSDRGSGSSSSPGSSSGGAGAPSPSPGSDTRSAPDGVGSDGGSQQ